MGDIGVTDKDFDEGDLDIITRIEIECPECRRGRLAQEFHPCPYIEYFCFDLDYEDTVCTCCQDCENDCMKDVHVTSIEELFGPEPILDDDDDLW